MAPASRLRCVYFFYYAGVGVLLPYFAAYLRGLGWSGEQIGVAQTFPALLAPAVAMGWAAWSDRHAGPARALALAATWAALAAALLPFVTAPVAVGVVLLLLALGERAVVPLVDAVTLEHVRTHPGASYTRIRLFGSIGFIAATVGMGRLLTLRGDRPGDAAVPIATALLVAGYALAARRVPPAPRHEARPGLADVLALLKQRRLLLLLGACAVHWGATAPFHLLFGVFVRDHGLPADVTGLGMGVGVAAEIAVLLAFPRLAARLPLRALFALAFAGSAVRWALLSRAETAWAIVALQVLHGLTFGLFWGSAVQAMQALAPPNLRATGQALFSAVVFGGGNALGFALSGAGYDRYGSAAPLFAWAAGLEVLLVGVGAAAFRFTRAAAPEGGLSTSRS